MMNAAASCRAWSGTQIRARLDACPSLSSALLMWLAALLLLLSPSVAQANQVSKACGKKWLKQFNKLEPDQREWLLKKRTAEATLDLDGDGRPDTLWLTSAPSFRNCDVKNVWDLKETVVRIDYASGKSQIFHWINGNLVEEMKVYSTARRILLVAVDHRGSPSARWVIYRGVPLPGPSTAIAEGSRDPQDDAPVRIAEARLADARLTESGSPLLNVE